MNSNQVFSHVWAAFDAGELVIVCAWCGRIKLDGDWFRPPSAVADAVDAPLAFSHSICSRCAEAFLPPPAPAPTVRSARRQAGAEDRGPLYRLPGTPVHRLRAGCPAE